MKITKSCWLWTFLLIGLLNFLIPSELLADSVKLSTQEGTVSCVEEKEPCGGIAGLACCDGLNNHGKPNTLISIDEHLVRNAVKRQGIRVDDKAIDHAVDKFPHTFASAEMFQHQVNKRAEALSGLRRAVRIRRQERLPGGAVKPVSDSEVEVFYAQYRSRFEKPEHLVVRRILPPIIRLLTPKTNEIGTTGQVR